MKLIPAVDRADDAAGAARSLAELVGGEPQSGTTQVIAGVSREPTARRPPESVTNGSGRRIGRWLLGLAGFAAAVLSIVLLIKTPYGTLRIESEAENVQIELVDEANHTTTVQIEEGENATQLRAGKYRIRLAGKHDNLALTPDAIELRRGDERLARITQLPPGVSERNTDGASRQNEPNIPAINEELTRVFISVMYEDGRPATGAEVTMRMQGAGMQGEPERPVVVTGKADAQGVAFNRNLPYGKYEMTIKSPEHGTAHWSADSRDILLEFGGSFEQKIIAPTPAERATVKVHTAFSPAGLAGLRFGGYTGRQGDFGVGIVWSPEPGQQNDRFAHFPTLGHGISDVALLITMRVARDIKQPSGQPLVWNWMRGGDFYPDHLLVTDESVADFNEVGWDGKIAFDFSDSKYFRIMPKNRGVQYFAFRDFQRASNPGSLELPPGKLECELRSFFGKATREVVQALGLEPQPGREIWLEAKLNAESAWVPRGVDLSGWSQGKEFHNVLVYKTLSLEPGETQTIRVASPDPASVDGSGTPEVEDASGRGQGSGLDEPSMPATNEELTRAAISVMYEDGRPAVGAAVTMRMQGNPERPVAVTGIADAQGEAFNRNLPYGKYEVTIKVPETDGGCWSATLGDVLLEFGTSFEQPIIAPTPEKRATVNLHTALNPAGLEGLGFGSYMSPSDGRIAISPSEPGKQDDQIADFPVLGNGISNAALRMWIWVTRDVKQTSGKMLDWHWTREKDNRLHELIITDESVIDPRKSSSDIAYNIQKSEYFRNSREEYGVAYRAFFDQQRAGNPLSLEFPPGKLRLEVRAFIGKATSEVIRALGLEPQAGREVWLEANLNAESAWVPRAIDLSDWSRGKYHGTLATKMLSLEPGETQALRVASPDPSSVDELGMQEP